MNFIFLILSMILALLVLFIFFSLSKKEKWDSEIFTSFECGFSSYFYSRFSFSIHYFMVGLIFLFLDLELCMLMPFFNELISSTILTNIMMLFVGILLWGLLEEWKEGKLEWLN